MQSLTFSEIKDLMLAVSGDCCFLSLGQVRTIRHHAEWPTNRNELLTARQAAEAWPVSADFTGKALA